jgi:hypothetical protein
MGAEKQDVHDRLDRLTNHLTNNDRLYERLEKDDPESEVNPVYADYTGDGGNLGLAYLESQRTYQSGRYGTDQPVNIEDGKEQVG